MRLILAAILLTLTLPAAAQSAARPRPSGAMPLEEPPPPPAMTQTDSALEPQVTIRKDGEQDVQEYRVKGKLFMQRVTPRHGRPYILVDHRGDGTFTRQDNTLDAAVRVPQWVLLEF